MFVLAVDKPVINVVCSQNRQLHIDRAFHSLKVETPPVFAFRIICSEVDLVENVFSDASQAGCENIKSFSVTCRQIKIIDSALICLL